MISYNIGNILNSNANYICHQVNCKGKMDTGIGKIIKEKYPEAYNDYIKWYQDAKFWGYDEDRPEKSYPASCWLYGDIRISQVDNDKNIIHMAAQDDYGNDGKKYTSYDRFWSCLYYITQEIPKNSTLAFPFDIGSGISGANSNVIQTMIIEMLSQDYDIEFWSL